MAGGANTKRLVFDDDTTAIVSVSVSEKNEGSMISLEYKLCFVLLWHETG